MVSWIISRLVVLIFGTLYPAYYSYKAVKSKDIKEYVKWMMYWIIFALFTTVETVTDIFLSWFPFYYELKIAFVAWLLSPYTRGSSLLYRKFVHPTLSSKEKEIDDCLIQAKDRSYDALVHFGKRGLNVAASAAVTAAAKGQGALSERLRSFSMQDLSTIRGETPVPPPVTVRTNNKQSKAKTPRSAPQGTDNTVCACCSGARILKDNQRYQIYESNVTKSELDQSIQLTCVVELDVEEFETQYEANCEVKESVQEDDNGSTFMEPVSKHKMWRKKEQPVQAPPRIFRPRFRKTNTISSNTETM
ncbi:receptor expression-enhancing protein 1 isoform X1 [Microcaecilia unicolor]|uniref:Receptor expression-enhancing protein n=1 Tax=Microcaecilia unicolor TaxID=1415580 RepID=A0A6P7X9X0_9AMPH|nr:receptor expression-enhancing protein 1 isoform X1 [Microcaecilia unicolor]